MDTRKYSRVRTNTHKYAEYAQYAQIRRIRTNTYGYANRYAQVRTSTHKCTDIHVAVLAYRFLHRRHVILSLDITAPSQPYPGMYSKEFLKGKTAKELAQVQNGKSYGVSESKSAAGSKPMSAIRAKLDAIKKQKISAIQKDKSASDSVQQLLAALSNPDKAPVRKPKAPACKPAKAKDETADLIKKLIGALQSTQANNPKAKAKVQELDPDSDDEESDEEEEEEE